MFQGIALRNHDSPPQHAFLAHHPRILQHVSARPPEETPNCRPLLVRQHVHRDTPPLPPPPCPSQPPSTTISTDPAPQPDTAVTPAQEPANVDLRVPILEIPLPLEIASWLLDEAGDRYTALTDNIPHDRLERRLMDTIGNAADAYLQPSDDTTESTELTRWLLLQGMLAGKLPGPDDTAPAGHDARAGDPQAELARIALPPEFARWLQNMADAPRLRPDPGHRRRTVPPAGSRPGTPQYRRSIRRRLAPPTQRARRRPQPTPTMVPALGDPPRHPGRSLTAATTLPPAPLTLPRAARP